MCAQKTFKVKFLADAFQRLSSRPVLNDCRFSRDAITSIVPANPKSSRQLWLLGQLFDRPFAMGDIVRHFDLKKGDNRWLAAAVNLSVRRRIRELGITDLPDEPAVLVRTLSGESNLHGFGVMALNPGIFKLPEAYSELVIGRDVTLIDLLSPSRLRILRILLEHPGGTSYGVFNMLKAQGNKFSMALVRDALQYGLNKSFTSRGLPPALLSTTTEPSAYSPNPEFVDLFSLPVSEPHGPVEYSFGERDQKIIYCIAGHVKTSPGQIREATGLGISHSVNALIRRIESRCAEIGLPGPVDRERSGQHIHFSMRPKFRVSVVKKEAKPALEDFFTEQQLAAVLAIIATPHISSTDLAKQLGISLNALKFLVYQIKKVSRSQKLGKLKTTKVGSNNEYIYRFDRKFIKNFDLKEGAVDFRRQLRGKQLEVYDYLQGKEIAYLKDACKELHLDRKAIWRIRKILNRKLKTAGLSKLSAPFRGMALKRWKILRLEILAKRKELGRWPRLNEFGNCTDPVRMGISRYFGGIRKAIEKVKSDMDVNDFAELIYADLTRQALKYRTKKNGKPNGKNLGNGQLLSLEEIATNLSVAFERGTARHLIHEDLDAGRLQLVLVSIGAHTSFPADSGSPMGDTSFQNWV